MTTSRDDLREFSDHVWRRLRDRMEGLTDEEYRWEPAPGFTTLAWRLCHIIGFLEEDRNGPWLGRPAVPRNSDGDPRTAEAALDALEAAYATWEGILASTTEESLQEPIGALAGRYGNATRRSFVHHVLDELIHHGAEAAMMRDLYAAAPKGPVRTT